MCACLARRWLAGWPAGAPRFRPPHGGRALSSATAPLSRAGGGSGGARTAGNARNWADVLSLDTGSIVNGDRFWDKVAGPQQGPGSRKGALAARSKGDFGRLQVFSNAGRDTGLPPVPGFVVVEGTKDAMAALRSVAGHVLVMGGANEALDAAQESRLTKAVSMLGTPILLLDPDHAGRQMRRQIERKLPGVSLHAFVPGNDAVLRRAVGDAEVGELGVEHARPDAIRRALARSRRADMEREEFTREDLQRWGLGGHDFDVSAKVKDLEGAGVHRAGLRRKAVATLLGIGNCPSKVFVRDLNHYGFEREEVARCLGMAERWLETLGKGTQPDNPKDSVGPMRGAGDVT